MAQGALGAAGIRRVWAGAGLQRAAYRGVHIARLPAQLVLLGSYRPLVNYTENISIKLQFNFIWVNCNLLN